MRVPEAELEYTFSRSSGPGGQNVNKTSTKVRLRWNVGRSVAFSESQKSLIRRAAGRGLNAADEIVITSERERSQAQNRQTATARLEQLVSSALRPRRKRIAVTVSRSDKRRRLEDKHRTARKKESRRPPSAE